MDLDSMATAICNKIMVPNSGIFVLEEYVGPVRFQFPPKQQALMADFLSRVVCKYKNFSDVLKQIPLWRDGVFYPPDAATIAKDDPSETVRGNEINSVLQQYFTMVEDVPLGRTFSQWIFHNI
jgi:hypothetical protein